MAAASSPIEPNKVRGEKEMVVYIQDGVFVHTAVPITAKSASIIPGKVKIIEKENSSYVDWSPCDSDDEDQFELQSSDYSAEWDLITQSKQQDGNVQQKRRKSKYAINFNTAELHSIRRSDPKLTWSYAVFILKDGTTLPALHFHSGGISEMIRRLQRYIWLVKASHNNKLFVVSEDHNALKKSLDQLQLFSDENLPAAAPWQRFINSAYYDGMDALSKVTRYVRDVYEGLQQGTENTQGGLQGEMPPETGKKDVEFEHLGGTTHDTNYTCPEKRDLGEPLEVQRCEPMALDEWQSLFDGAGRATNIKKLLDRIFRGGVHDSIRKSVWSYLLGYRKYGRTSESQQNIALAKRDEYQTMKRQWQSMTATQESNFTEFRERKHLIDKDVARTDRLNSFYSDTNYSNVEKLYNILLTYCMYNFDLGYVQGMSDLLSPILFVMKNEDEAFWCFVGLMEKLAHNFDENQEGMKAQLHQLTVLLRFTDPHFYSYLEQHESGNMYFCFRWLLICFKRDFTFPDIAALWETLWSQRLSPNYHLIVCLAILDQHRQVIMENGFGFNEILKYINDLAYNIDVQQILIKAEALCLQLIAFTDLPEEVRAILTGRNEAMMTPNVERPDPFLMDYSRHVARLLELNQNNGPQCTGSPTSPPPIPAQSSQLSDSNGENSNENTNETNDLNIVSASAQQKGGSNSQEETPFNVEEQCSEDEIVVLSEEASNVF